MSALRSLDDHVRQEAWLRRRSLSSEGGVVSMSGGPENRDAHAAAYTAPLSRPQEIALGYIERYGEASEATLFLEGLNMPRLTMRALERRGLVRRGEWENEYEGYVWERVDAA